MTSETPLVVGEGVDTILFVLIAFAGAIPREVLVLTIVSNYLFKTGLEALVTPLTYQVVNFLKMAEEEDCYDYNADFNPFKISISG